MLPRCLPSRLSGLEEEGKTAVMVTVDGEAVGVVAVADTDKEASFVKEGYVYVRSLVFLA